MASAILFQIGIPGLPRPLLVPWCEGGELVTVEDLISTANKSLTDVRVEGLQLFSGDLAKSAVLANYRPFFQISEQRIVELVANVVRRTDDDDDACAAAKKKMKKEVEEVAKKDSAPAAPDAAAAATTTTTTTTKKRDTTPAQRKQKKPTTPRGGGDGGGDAPPPPLRTTLRTTPARRCVAAALERKRKETEEERKGERNDESEFFARICGCCLSPDWTPSNKIVICDGCDVGVHQQCDGDELAARVPSGKWYCPACKRKRRDGRDLAAPPKCVLCLRAVPALLSMPCRDAGHYGGRGFAHEVCARMLEGECFFTQANSIDVMLPADPNAKFASRARLCEHCDRRGAPAKCDKCDRCAHASCAHEAPGWRVGCSHVYCPDHAHCANCEKKPDGTAKAQQAALVGKNASRSTKRRTSSSSSSSSSSKQKKTSASQVPTRGDAKKRKTTTAAPPHEPPRRIKAETPPLTEPPRTPPAHDVIDLTLDDDDDVIILEPPDGTPPKAPPATTPVTTAAIDVAACPTVAVSATTGSTPSQTTTTSGSASTTTTSGSSSSGANTTTTSGSSSSGASTLPFPTEQQDDATLLADRVAETAAPLTPVLEPRTMTL